MAQDPIKILVVDDDPALLAVLEASLRMQEDYAVTAVGSAPQAMHLVRQQAFDIVITDYSLNDPGINGLAILRTAREQSDRTLVVMITAFASLEITLESIHLGAHDFLTKPFQLDELQLVIRNAADRIRLERENHALRLQVARMITELDEIERQHGALLDRIREMDLGGGGEATSAPVTAQFNHTSLQEMHRRRVSEQLSTYVRMGETIRERLTRERQKIESLFEKGLLPESTYRRALMDRKSDNAGT